MSQAILPNVLGQIYNLIEIAAGEEAVVRSESLFEFLRCFRLLIPAFQGGSVFVRCDVPVSVVQAENHFRTAPGFAGREIAGNGPGEGKNGMCAVAEILN